MDSSPLPIRSEGLSAKAQLGLDRSSLPTWRHGATNSPRVQNSRARGKAAGGFSAEEREGFEPSVPCGTHDFQSCTFGHSVISPGERHIFVFQRREWESNPRYLSVHLISNQAPSATRSSLPMISLGYLWLFVSNISIVPWLCLNDVRGPTERQHMPRLQAMGQAEVNLRALVVNWVKAACGHEPTAGAGPVLAEVSAVTFPRNSCRM